MTLAARTQALLALVEDDRRTQCQALQAEAEARAAALLAQVRAQARAQVHEALLHERARLAAALAAARAELRTRRRLHEQRRIQTLLALGWRKLPALLAARWSDADARRAWIEQACARARAALPPPAAGGGAAQTLSWQVSHGGGWPEDERAAFGALLARELGAAPLWRHDERIAAGLRIAAGGNVVDATLAGLLADRDEVGGRLVGLLQGKNNDKDEP